MEHIKVEESLVDKEVGDITRILHAWNSGDSIAIDNLMPFVINELRQIARKNLRKYSNNGADNTLQATAIVNEAYLKLRSVKQSNISQRGDFYALCAEVIKHIIIDYVRRKRAARRGGGIETEPLDEVLNFSWVRNSKNTSVEDLVIFQEVLHRLEANHNRESHVLSLKYYVGLTDEEIANSLDISIPTVRRDLTFARAWIRREVDTMTSEIFGQAVNIKDAAGRKEFLQRACAGDECLLKDVEVLLRKAKSPKDHEPA